jgi:hypothetical protein
MWVNIQRITGVAHCANVVWPDLARAVWNDLELTSPFKGLVICGWGVAGVVGPALQRAAVFTSHSTVQDSGALVL